MYSAEELRGIRYQAALELLAFKAKVVMEEANGSKYNYSPSISVKDINECFVVAGMPVVVPDDLKEKELEVM